MRRALGHKLVDHGWLLADFASFMEDCWRHDGDHSIWPWPGPPSHKMSCHRGGPPASEWCVALPATCAPSIPATEVPPVGLLEARNRRAVPYLYSEGEVASLMTATGSLRPALHAATYRTLIGLLAVTGMRLGEAIRLDRTDLDLESGAWSCATASSPRAEWSPCIRPLWKSWPTTGGCENKHSLTSRTERCWSQSEGSRLIRQNIEYVFARLVRVAARAPLGAVPSEACTTSVTRWQSTPCSTGIDKASTCSPVYRLLSTFLGHTQPANTYWYLSAVPELLALAAERRQQGWECAHECARPNPRGLLHRAPHRPTLCQPQHGGRLSGRLAAFVALCPATTRASNPASSTWATSTLLSWPASSTTWRQSGPTACAPATLAWLPSARSSATRRCVILSMPDSSPGCSPSPPSGPSATSCPTSKRPR